MANFARKLKRKKKNEKVGVNNVTDFDPKLDMRQYISIFSAKVQVLNGILEEITSLSENDLQDKNKTRSFSIELSGDYMFDENSLDIAKKYTKQVDKMGGVFLPAEVEKQFSEEELKNYYAQNFKLYMYMHMYYNVFLKKLLIKINNDTKMSNEHKDKILEVIFPDYKNYYKDSLDMLLNIEKDLIPEYFEGAANNECNKFVLECYNGEKHNSKLFFKYGVNQEKRKNISDNELFEYAKDLLEIVSEFN